MEKQDKLIARLFKDTLIIFLLSMFVSTIGYVIDGIIIGEFLGTEAIAAFGLTMPYQRFVTIFPAVIVLGMQVLCSKALGRGDLREANEIFSLAMVAALSIAILLTGGTLLFPEQLADILDAEESLGAIRGLTIDFMQAYAFGLPAMASVILLPIMQLDNDRRRMVISAATFAICDIVGDLLNVFVLDGGLWGMGITTAVSHWIAAGVLLMHFLKPDSSFKFLPKAVSLRHFRQMILIGLPVILGRGTAVLRIAFFTRMSVVLAGEVGVAAYAVLENFSGLLEIIPRAFGASTQMIGGILIGEQDRNSILRLMKLALKSSLIISLIMTAGVFLGAPLIADLYTQEIDATTYQTTLEGLQLAIAFLPLCTVGIIFQYYYQACGRFRLVSGLTIAGNVGFIVPIALLLTAHFGLDGLWLAFPLSYAAFLITIFVITCRHCGRITFRLEDYLLLPEGFDVVNDKQLNITVTNKAEVLGLSERTQNFCEASGIDSRRSMFAGICIEEMAGNIVDYGFDDEKNHFVDVRVIVKGEQVIIRMRDDCRSFDPKKQAELHNPEDHAAHIGIRLVRKISTEFDYVNALKLNNLIIKI